MSSPRSMWTGSIQVGMFNIPATVGKAWSDQRVSSGLKDICADHVVGLDRSERCTECDGPPQRKGKAVKTETGEWREILASEMTQIEDATKLDTLVVDDVQPIGKLPLAWSTGTYYVRADKKVKGSENSFAYFVDGLRETGMGAVCKWGPSASQQKLVILRVQGNMLFMHTIPMASEIRMPEDEEQRHAKVERNDEAVSLVKQLLAKTQNPEGFQYAKYVDDGTALREDAVAKLLAGEQNESEGEQPKPTAPQDLMDALKASIAESEKEEVNA